MVIECRSEYCTKWCTFHPSEMVVGICPLCLNDRLLILAASRQTNRTLTAKKAPVGLTKIFALSTLLNRVEIRQENPDRDRYLDSSSTSPEESFISIKFEDNGVASWEKGKPSKVLSHDQPRGMSWGRDKKAKSLVEHAKLRPALRWRKRIGHLFHLIRWKKSTKGSVCHVGTKHRRGKGTL